MPDATPSTQQPQPEQQLDSTPKPEQMPAQQPQPEQRPDSTPKPDQAPAPIPTPEPKQTKVPAPTPTPRVPVPTPSAQQPQPQPKQQPSKSTAKPQASAAKQDTTTIDKSKEQQPQSTDKHKAVVWFINSTFQQVVLSAPQTIKLDKYRVNLHLPSAITIAPAKSDKELGTVYANANALDAVVDGDPKSFEQDELNGVLPGGDEKNGNGVFYHIALQGTQRALDYQHQAQQEIGRSIDGTIFLSNFRDPITLPESYQIESAYGTITLAHSVTVPKSNFQVATYVKAILRTTQQHVPDKITGQIYQVGDKLTSITYGFFTGNAEKDALKREQAKQPKQAEQKQQPPAQQPKQLTTKAIPGTGNYFPAGQCTWWANQRYHELFGVWVPWTINANAYQWVDRAVEFNWHVSDKPVVGSIVVLAPGVTGSEQPVWTCSYD
ncbi:hypothetical protein EI42_04310 [Thermosporothrix hazakensis]|jgi:hypothetical protein|uniref:Peptidase C51 domain-containing protein n=2 Tax=Thermosporothrix hazakensis TaxID=644383 RepID=A0A326U1S4_THEHA|nr:CHAP domain-containing protein [Thermosporothrix hazakensis]PZW25258.1 hypothetical protein EI42_04310 [Thermosporothrix hazakensis]